ncbi:hypothetical protein NIES2119_30700 [[Phormidium ambiguum] IAM M-71]|uniref:Uncharacterized protein n=1 Tax=[Phormidium ambiguum] IAM M-71 TaxID=454136 RepID=A0A1U7I3C6_9CYAN|nr:hypothetical protein [Phormidium ambiguum]OKH30614.1 hypothetical protein NIES2119_30700 [Phormidium ambiguum IAM M-71]
MANDNLDKIFDRPIPGETAKAFEWFCRYRDLGGERTLVKVAELYGKETAYIQQLQKWSCKHHWVSRTLSFDQYRNQILLDEQDRIEIERARLSSQQWNQRQKELREEEWEMSRLLLAKAREMLSYSLDERRWTFRDAAAMIQLGMELAKSATEITEMDVLTAIKTLADADILPGEVCERLK